MIEMIAYFSATFIKLFMKKLVISLFLILFYFIIALVLFKVLKFILPEKIIPFLDKIIVYLKIRRTLSQKNKRIKK